LSTGGTIGGAARPEAGRSKITGLLTQPSRNWRLPTRLRVLPADPGFTAGPGHEGPRQTTTEPRRHHDDHMAGLARRAASTLWHLQIAAAM
jgi:hypothetical protein